MNKNYEVERENNWKEKSIEELSNRYELLEQRINKLERLIEIIQSQRKENIWKWTVPQRPVRHNYM